MSDEKLLPCPFCGATPQCVAIDVRGCLVFCQSAGCAIEDEGKTPDEWNRRAIDEQVRDRDELLEAAQAEIERLRKNSRDAVVREIRDRDEILAVRDDALRRLRVAEEALALAAEAGCCDICESSFHVAGCATLRCREALAKIRGGAVK